MTWVDDKKNARDAPMRALNRKRKEAVYQFLASSHYKPKLPFDERIATEPIEDYVFRMRLYRWVIGRYMLPRLVEAIDRVKAQVRALDPEAPDEDRTRLTLSLLIADRNRLLRHMALINENLGRARGIAHYFSEANRARDEVKKDLDQLIKAQLFTPDNWT